MDTNPSNVPASDDPVPSDAKPTIGKAIIFLFVLALIAGGIAAFVISNRSPTGPLVAIDQPEAISVRTTEVALLDTFASRESFTGLATPRRSSMLGFQSGGRIDSITVDIGSNVRRGQVLARLDTRALKAQLATAEAGVDEARAGRDLAQTNVERQKTLFEKGHVSEQRVDEAQAQVDTANARINAAQSQADALEVQIDLSRITAPFSGVVTKRLTDEGAIAAPGTPILELVENSRMEARIGLPAVQAASLSVGETYDLETRSGEVTATLRAVTGVIDASARTVTTVFDLDSAGVPAGAVIRLSLDKDIEERGTWVPIGALTEGSRGLWAVFVAEQAGDEWIAQRRPVEIVQAEADRAYVRGALADGDLVILDGITRLSPGIPVTPDIIELADRQGE